MRVSYSKIKSENVGSKRTAVKRTKGLGKAFKSLQ